MPAAAEVVPQPRTSRRDDPAVRRLEVFRVSSKIPGAGACRYGSEIMRDHTKSRCVQACVHAGMYVCSCICAGVCVHLCLHMRVCIHAGMCGCGCVCVHKGVSVVSGCERKAVAGGGNLI